MAASGVASRRKCETIIRAGRVKINDIPTTDPFYPLQGDDIVSMDEKTIQPQKETSVVILNKPKGVITTVHDTHGRSTVMDIVETKERLFPIGRLDKDTTGILLLTNDGNLAYSLTHPKFEVEKVYVVTLHKHFDIKDARKISSGIDLGNGEIGKGTVLNYTNKNEKQKAKVRSKIKISLSHGKKREVKRLFSALGYRVLILHRESFAGIFDDGLKPGEWRYMTKNEVQQIIKNYRWING